MLRDKSWFKSTNSTSSVSMSSVSNKSMLSDCRLESGTSPLLVDDVIELKLSLILFNSKLVFSINFLSILVLSDFSDLFFKNLLFESYSSCLLPVLTYVLAVNRRLLFYFSEFKSITLNVFSGDFMLSKLSSIKFTSSKFLLLSFDN